MTGAQAFLELPPAAIVGTLAAMAIGGMVLGQITDAVMGDRGFGPLGNGFLAILGASLGTYGQMVFSGVHGEADILMAALTAAGAATGMLLLFVIAKSVIQNVR